MARSSSADLASAASTNHNNDPDGNVSGSPQPGRGGAWLGWALLVAFMAIVVIAVVSATRSISNNLPNRGPADEAAPGAQPTRDIDRSRSP